MCLAWISTRVSSEPFQVEQSFSYLEIQGIQSNKPTQVQTTKFWHCSFSLLSFLFITSQHTWQHLDCIQMHVSCKTLTAFPHEAKAGFQVSLVSSLKTLTLSSLSLHHVGLLNWRSEKGLQLCINSLTWVSLLRLSGENQSSRGVCASSHPHPIPLCVSPPAAGVGAWARLVEPPAGLCRGSGQGDRSHRQLSAPDLPCRRTGVGTTRPAAADTVRLITQNHNLTEGWKDPLSVK